ncbi:hypothetical protein [uncultured Microscilla sp.]|uniref:hypothetical protein n=1 Tax=uncultured Microscilla sp. TaxID=432653 RepID=UPI0026264570|nr:hypothetical protein [uncultured Microscilla sp.]
MSYLLQGIGIGVGFILGIVLVAIIIVILARLFKRGSSYQEFTPELFEQYRDEILMEENFEEANVVSQIIDDLRNHEYPKKLLKDYTVKKDVDFIIKSQGESGEIISFKEKLKIVRK